MTTETQGKKRVLMSAEMVNAAGILRWCINGYKHKRDRLAMLNVIKSWVGPSEETYKKLLQGEIPWETDEKGNVTFFE